MRKLVIEEWISLDGYVADKHNSLDFFTPLIRQSYQENERKEFLNSIDMILFGRKTYEQFVKLWPDRDMNDPLVSIINQTRKIVFSKSMSIAPWGRWAPAEIIDGNVNMIKQCKMEVGKSIVVWGSISLAQLLMKEKLVDELRLHICPVLTGGGRKLFAEGDSLSIGLKESNRNANGTVLLKCQPEFSLK